MDHVNFSRDSMFAELARIASSTYCTNVNTNDVWLCQKSTDNGLSWFVLINNVAHHHGSVMIGHAPDQTTALLNAVDYLQSGKR